jgi:hypothetical protein
MLLHYRFLWRKTLKHKISFCFKYSEWFGIAIFKKTKLKNCYYKKCLKLNVNVIM